MLPLAIFINAVNIKGMSTVPEIESALKELPLHEAQSVSHWLQDYLQQQNTLRSSPSAPPDYAARRRSIMGDKVLPNMVLLDRESER